MTKKKSREKGKFTISQTGMNRFATCPRQYRLGKELEPLQMPSFVEFGLNVHAALGGTKKLEDLSQKEMEAFGTMRAMEKLLEYQPIYREYKQYFPLGDDMDGVRILDFVGYQNGEGVVVDYKFPVYPWYTKDGITSKSRGWQAAMYLMMPYREYVPTDMLAWPGRLDFLVHPTNIYIYHIDIQKEKEVIEQAKLVKYAEGKGWFPRNEGIACKYCSFFDACHQTKGWQDKYKDRREDK